MMIRYVSIFFNTRSFKVISRFDENLKKNLTRV